MSRSETRGLARTILVLLATMLVAFLLFSSTPSGVVNAQSTPNTDCGADIFWLNPDDDDNDDAIEDAPEIVSGEEHGDQDADDGRYHLVAWVNEVPDDPVVDFILQQEGENDEVIASSEASGSTPEIDLVENVAGDDDTYEYFWDVDEIDGSPDDGAYTLVVRLYADGEDDPCSEDEEPVSVNNEGNELEPAAERPEIIHPQNGKELGFYRRENGSTSTSVEVEASGPGPEGPPPSSDTGTSYIRLKYSVSFPGSEPQWKNCTNGSPAGVQRFTAGTGSQNFRCDLATSDEGSDVTAFMVQANSTPQNGGSSAPYNASFDGATDAHRIIAYDQEPTTVSVQFAEDDGVPSGEKEAEDVEGGGCSPIVIVTVTDQQQLPIAGAEVDAHAQGPTDALRFAAGRSGDTFQAPDEGEDHDSENASNCLGGNSGMQGDHEVSGSQPDTKHIESLSETDGDGRWSFSLFHPDADTRGETAITAWADFDFDDEFCDDEPSDSAGIGWGSAVAPNDDLPSTVASCVFATPTPSRTTTASPTPSGSATTTGSPSPTSTSTTTGPDDGRDTRRVNTNLSIRFRRGAFKGRVRSSVGRCEKGRSITLRKEKRGGDARSGRDRSNNRGRWKIRKRRAQGSYYAVAARKVFTRGNTRFICRPGRSDQVRVRG